MEAINALTMRLVNVILWYSPIGIFFLIAGQFAGVSLKSYHPYQLIYSLAIAHSHYINLNLRL